MKIFFSSKKSLQGFSDIFWQLFITVVMSQSRMYSPHPPPRFTRTEGIPCCTGLFQHLCRRASFLPRILWKITLRCTEFVFPLQIKGQEKQRKQENKTELCLHELGSLTDVKRSLRRRIWQGEIQKIAK